MRRGAGVVDRGALEKRCGLTGHRGFESHPLRLIGTSAGMSFFFGCLVDLKMLKKTT